MTQDFFITFEGGEGAGKSTQIARLAALLRDGGKDVVVTREPGGSPGAEALRHVILSGAAEPFGPGLETLLFAAARADHVDSVILPGIRRGAIVLCDRFIDSSRVYQGLASPEARDLVATMEPVAIGGAIPDMTLVFDLDPVEGLRRAGRRRGADSVDRFEREDLEIHRQRREAFLEIARAEPGRCIVIDAAADADTIETIVVSAVIAALNARAEPGKDEP